MVNSISKNNSPYFGMARTVTTDDDRVIPTLQELKESINENPNFEVFDAAKGFIYEAKENSPGQYSRETREQEVADKLKGFFKDRIQIKKFTGPHESREQINDLKKELKTIE